MKNSAKSAFDCGKESSLNLLVPVESDFDFGSLILPDKVPGGVSGH